MMASVAVGLYSAQQALKGKRTDINGTCLLPHPRGRNLCRCAVMQSSGDHDTPVAMQSETGKGD